MAWDTPLIIPSFKNEEEKLKETRQSGLLNKNKEQLCCKKCGSLNIQVQTPIVDDFENGEQLPYICMNCGYNGIAKIKILGIDENGVIQAQLVPQGLVGL